MATKTLTQKLKPNQLYSIKSRCEGKYDDVRTHTFTKENPSLAIDMEDYDGLTSNYEEDKEIIDFSGTVLPWKYDYNSSLETTRYGLIDSLLTDRKRKVETSFNCEKIGSPTISSNYILSNVSTSSMVKTPVLNYSVPFKMEMHIAFSSYPNTWPFKSPVNASLDTYFGNSMIMAIGNGSNYHDLAVYPTLPFDGTLFLEWDGYEYKYWAETTDGSRTYGPVYYSSSSRIPNSVMEIGRASGATFDLKKFKFTSNNSDYSFEAYKETVLFDEVVPGCYYNYDGWDDGQERYLNCFTKDNDKGIYLSPYDTIEGERYLGQVLVPAHTVSGEKTITIIPTPTDAIVGFMVEGKYIAENVTSYTFDSETTVTYVVSKEGYESKSAEVVIRGPRTIKVDLEQNNDVIDISDYAFIVDDDKNVTFVEYTGNNTNVVVPTKRI